MKISKLFPLLFVLVLVIITITAPAAMAGPPTVSVTYTVDPSVGYTSAASEDPEVGAGGLMSSGTGGNSQYSSFYGRGYAQNASATTIPVDTRLWFGRSSYGTGMTGAYRSATRFAESVGGTVATHPNGYMVYYTAMVPK